MSNLLRDFWLQFWPQITCLGWIVALGLIFWGMFKLGNRREDEKADG